MSQTEVWGFRRERFQDKNGATGALPVVHRKGAVMAFEYQSISTQPNRSVVLNFSAPVVFYLPGISYYSLTHGRKDHHVQELGLSLEVNQPSPQQLQVQVNGIMRDSSGNGIDDVDSRVTVVVLA